MTTRTMGRAPATWAWLAGWTVANVLGWSFGLLLFISVGWGLQERLERGIGGAPAALVGFTLAGLAAGAVIGLLQAIALGGSGVPALGWAAATCGAYGVGLGLMMALVVALDPGQRFDPIVFPIMLIPALLLAAAQWLVLRRALSRSGWWIIAGALGFTLAFLGAMSLGGEGRELVAAAGGGLAYAVVTGPAMAWLRGQGRHP